ncbi:glycerol-3-phosphate regulon repressor [Brucella melitensis]|nr:glycerol-3-phosphate regulon repressor [Brucella melitensis]
MQLTPRHHAIVELARRKGQVLVDDLAVAFDVTPQTVRKDLNDLCRARLLRRIHGGALYPSGVSRRMKRNPSGVPRLRSSRMALRFSSISGQPPRLSVMRLLTIII